MAAAIGHGADFKRDAGGSPSVFSTVGEVLDISGPSLSRDVVETTHMGSTEKWREFIGGLKDGGEVSFEINFDPTDSAISNLLTDLNTDTTNDYQVEWPDGSQWTFSAFLRTFDIQAPMDDRMTANCSFKLNGKPYFVA